MRDNSGRHAVYLHNNPESKGIRMKIDESVALVTGASTNPWPLEPDAKLDEYPEIRVAMGKTLKAVMASADPPTIVADVVLEAARAARPKLRYTAGGLASRLRLLHRFAPAALMDGGIRNDLQLDAPAGSR